MGIFDSIKRGFSKVLDVGNRARNMVGSVWNTARNIPVVGDILKKTSEMPLFGGKSVKDIADYANTGLDTANNIGRGNYNQLLRGIL